MLGQQELMVCDNTCQGFCICHNPSSVKVPRKKGTVPCGIEKIPLSQTLFILVSPIQQQYTWMRMPAPVFRVCLHLSCQTRLWSWYKQDPISTLVTSWAPCTSDKPSPVEVLWRNQPMRTRHYFLWVDTPIVTTRVSSKCLLGHGTFSFQVCLSLPYL